MTEAIDDVQVISRVLAGLAVRERFIHADAALAGIPLALLDRADRPGFDLADGADSLSVSGHKFIGCPVPCGVLLTRGSLRGRIGRAVDYIGSIDSTVGGSRSGHAPLLLWYVTQRLGIEGLRRRADQSRALAGYTTARLREIGWEAWRHPHAFTVVLATPPLRLARRWMLASSAGRSHIICMPGVTREQIDTFLEELVEHAGPNAKPDHAAVTDAPAAPVMVVPSLRTAWPAGRPPSQHRAGPG